MVLPVATILQEIRALSLADKTELLRVLLEDLNEPTNSDVDATWAVEIQRRSQEIDEGAVKGIPAAEVFKKMATQIKK